MCTEKSIFRLLIVLLVLKGNIGQNYCRDNICNETVPFRLCSFQEQGPAEHCIEYEKTVKAQKEKEAILNKINSRRNKVAFGDIRSFGPAGNMMKMEWSEQLEKMAQNWADQCVNSSMASSRDYCLNLDSVGQNIATVYGDAPGLTPLVLVDVWYMELLQTNVSVISQFMPSSETGLSHYDYFTQLVWAESNYAGCGSVKFKELRRDGSDANKTVNRLVCNFSPGGNRRRQPVYIKATPCSQCPNGTTCDNEYKSLCKRDLSEEIKNDQSYNPNKDTTKRNVNSTTFTILETTTDENLDDENFTPYNYFSHFFQITQQHMASSTENKSVCKDVLAVDDFVELLKKRLMNDPMFKELLSSKINTQMTDNSFTDASVAAFVSRLYSKKEPSTTTKSQDNEYINSTLLVDLVEAVIFRSSDKLSTTTEMESNVQSIVEVSPVKIQAELSEVKLNNDFTGHYFFPEDDAEETTAETTVLYDDISNLPIADVVLEIEDMKREKITKDFLDEIFESVATTEDMSTPDSIAMDIMKYKTSHSVTKKILGDT